MRILVLETPARQQCPDALWITARELPVPRRRLGGTGTWSSAALNVWPSLPFGIPRSFVSQSDVEYYTGRARDIHGNPIGQEFVGHSFPFEGFDPNDPPTFESEAAYLNRHGLLTPEELRRLPAEAFDAHERLSPDGTDAA